MLNPHHAAMASSPTSGFAHGENGHLEDRAPILGGLGLCDVYPPVFPPWRGSPALAGQLPASPNLDRLQRRLFARPALTAIVGEALKLRMQA